MQGCLGVVGRLAGLPARLWRMLRRACYWCVWYVRLVRGNRDAFRLFCYSVLCVAWLCVVFVQSGLSASLGLLSSGFHFMHHTAHLCIGLASNYLSTRKPEEWFSYGYQRFEVVAEYAAGVLLVFSSFSIWMEAIHRMFHTDPVACQWTPLLCVIQVAIVSIGVTRFSEARQRLGISPYRRPGPLGARIVSQSVTSVVVGASSILILLTGFHRLDLIAACSNALWCMRQSLPSLRHTSAIMLQQAPVAVLPSLDKSMKEASTVEGVLECHGEHFWSLCDGILVGSLRIRVKRDAVEQQVLRSVYRLFEPLITHLTIQIEKDDWDIESKMKEMHDQWTSNLGGAVNAVSVAPPPTAPMGMPGMLRNPVDTLGARSEVHLHSVASASPFGVPIVSGQQAPPTAVAAGTGVAVMQQRPSISTALHRGTVGPHHHHGKTAADLLNTGNPT